MDPLQIAAGRHFSALGRVSMAAKRRTLARQV
jgi:hypothetical protein